MQVRQRRHCRQCRCYWRRAQLYKGRTAAPFLATAHKCVIGVFALKMPRVCHALTASCAVFVSVKVDIMTIGSPLRGATALVFLIAVFVAIWSPPASAQRADDIETLLEQSDQLTRAGKYREATETTKRLLTETE